MATSVRQDERAVRRHRWPAPCLMLITDRHRLRGRSLDEVASLAVEGGADVVQLRAKDLSGGDLFDPAQTVRRVLRGRCLLLVNDHVDVALAAGADGVHLPEHAWPGRALRELLGEDAIIGRSVHGVEAAVRAEADGVDYVQLGTIFETASKRGAAAAGVGLVRDVSNAVGIPVVAVGGITPDNAGRVLEAGASGVAVIGAIMDAADPRAAAAGLRRALNEASEA